MRTIDNGGWTGGEIADAARTEARMKEEARASRAANVAALDGFQARARKMPPTRAHRPAIWENMFGTLYARSPEGETRYFDYNWAEAIAFVGEVEDVRVARFRAEDCRLLTGREDYQAPRTGQLVWFAKDGRADAAEGRA